MMTELKGKGKKETGIDIPDAATPTVAGVLGITLIKRL